MNWEMIFTATNVVAAAGWLALTVLPRRNTLATAIPWGAVCLLCAAYLAMFVGLMGGLVDAGRGDAGATPAFEYTVEGLKAAFASSGVMVLGWTHYLAFDLFVGMWIARDADRLGVGRIAQALIFIPTYLAGPVGLLVWLFARRWPGLKPAR